MTINLKPQPPELGPRVFIGSSGSELGLAKQIQTLLGDDIDADVWDGDLADQLGNIILDELLLKVSLYDFAIMVLSADDVTTSKGKRKASPRDNVIFELGMFMGVRGRKRVFPVVVGSESTDLKVPTDLFGNKELRLDPEKLKTDAGYLAEQISALEQAIKKRSRGAALSLLPSAALAYGYVHNFLRPVSEHLRNGETRNPDETIKYDRIKYDFNIYMPEKSLSEASVEARDLLVEERGLLPFVVGPKPVPGRPDRTYSFFVKAKPEGGRTQFVDIPTTISTSDHIINLTLAEHEPGEQEDKRETMDKLEIINFAKAIRFIVKRSKIRFPREIKYWWIPDPEHDE
jgi:Predicted nucleotide-binding protein containing TIR-like domain